MTAPLSTAELAELERHWRTHNGGDLRIAKALAELIATRELLATPMPTHMLCPNADPPWADGSPFVTSPGEDGRVGIAAGRWVTDDLEIDEAIALGSALIRAALAARARAGRAVGDE